MIKYWLFTGVGVGVLVVGREKRLPSNVITLSRKQIADVSMMHILIAVPKTPEI